MAKNLKENKKKGFVRKAITAYNIFSIVYMVYAFMKSRGTGKEDDRHLIGKAIDRISGYDIDADSIITIDETDLHVSYNPYIHLFGNNLGSIACVINNTTEVYTDNTFRKLSKCTQKFVLAHELGHYKRNHNPDHKYQLNRVRAILKGQILDMEVEADEYACRMIRNHLYKKYGYDDCERIERYAAKVAIKALEELSSHSSGLSRKELKLRAKLIREFFFEGLSTEETVKKYICLRYSEEYKEMYS